MTRKWTIWILIIGGVALLTVAMVLVAERYYLRPLLVKTLKKSVSETSDGMYRIEFEKLLYKPFSGKAELTHIKLIPDTLLYRKRIENSNTSNFIYATDIEEILLTNICLFKLVLERKLEIDLIRINRPTVEITQRKQSKTPSNTESSPYKVISKFVKSFRVKKVEFNQMKFAFADKTKQKPERIVLDKLDIDITDFLIDSLSYLDTTRFYYSKNTSFKLSNLYFPSIGSLHDFRLDTISFSSEKKEIQVKGIHYMPKFEGRQYTTRANGNDRIALVFEDILVQQVDLKALIFDKKLMAERAFIQRGNIAIFSDGNPSTSSKIGKYPQQMFRELPFKMNIDTVHVENFVVSYAEYSPETNSNGGVNFRLVKGDLVNVTNDTLSLLKNPVCEARINGLFMGKALFTADFTFNIASKSGEFTCKGVVGAMDLRNLNPVIEALAMTKIESGQVQRFTFEVKGNEYNVAGKGTLIYHDLKVVFLKQDSDGHSQKRKFISGMANRLFIQNDNPLPNELPRTGQIAYKREPTKSYFATLWRSLQQSIGKCVLERRGLKQLKKMGRK